MGASIAILSEYFDYDLRFCLGLGLSRCRCWPSVLPSRRLGRLEAAAELAIFGRKWRMACNDFLAAVKGLAKPTKPTRWGYRGVKEGCLVGVLDFHL